MAGNNLVQFMRCTSSVRANSTKILLPSQPLYEKDTRKLYIGDGVTEARNLQAVAAQALAEESFEINGETVNIKMASKNNFGIAKMWETGSGTSRVLHIDTRP